MYQKIALLALAPVIIGLVIYLAGRPGELAGENRQQAVEQIPEGPSIGGLEAREYMLELVNEARTSAGVGTVRLGENPAAQMHAQESLDNCTMSHWDIWGLKPNQRYTLMGGTGTGIENALGTNYCGDPGEPGPYEGINRGDIWGAVVSWLESRGHRENLLHPRHTIMNVGIAYNSHNLAMTQQFSSDYVTYVKLPAISPEGVLEMQGNVRGAVLDTGSQVVMQIGYDPPPEPLTRGQLSKTNTLCNPKTVGTIWAEPPAAGVDRGPAWKTILQKSACRDPRENPRDGAPPASPQESTDHWKEAQGTSMLIRERPVQVLRVTPATLRITTHSFQVKANLKPILETYGPGVYSITVWGAPQGMNRSTILSDQSMFWMTAPPADSPYGNSREEEDVR